MRHTDPIVRSYAVTHPPGDVSLPTQPGWDQVIYAESGLFVARADRVSWTVPPHRALCIGDGPTMRLRTRRPTAVRCLYFRTELGALAPSIRVVNVTTLTRELILRAVELCPFSRQAATGSALLALLIEQLDQHPTAPLQLPLPADDRGSALAEVVLHSPDLSLAEAIGAVAASRRTLERIFATETGMTLARWQRRARVLAAIEHMTHGANVTETAAMVGYGTPSSFVAAFRSELDRTPRTFVAPRPKAPGNRHPDNWISDRS